MKGEEDWYWNEDRRITFDLWIIFILPFLIQSHFLDDWQCTLPQCDLFNWEIPIISCPSFLFYLSLVHSLIYSNCFWLETTKQHCSFGMRKTKKSTILQSSRSFLCVPRIPQLDVVAAAVTFALSLAWHKTALYFKWVISVRYLAIAASASTVGNSCAGCTWWAQFRVSSYLRGTQGSSTHKTRLRGLIPQNGISLRSLSTALPLSWSLSNQHWAKVHRTQVHPSIFQLTIPIFIIQYDSLASLPCETEEACTELLCACIRVRWGEFLGLVVYWSELMFTMCKNLEL